MLAAPFEGDDALAFVISHNLHRRHLSESQRAMIAKRVANMPRGRPSENTAIAAISVSQDEAASLLNVSERSVAMLHPCCTDPPEPIGNQRKNKVLDATRLQHDRTANLQTD
jgi:hypothetical protein